MLQLFKRVDAYRNYKLKVQFALTAQKLESSGISPLQMNGMACKSASIFPAWKNSLLLHRLSAIWQNKLA